MFTYALVLTNPPIDEETGEPTQGLQKLVRDMKLISGNGQPPATSSDIKWIPVEYLNDTPTATQKLVTRQYRNATDDAWIIHSEAVNMTPLEISAKEQKDARAEAAAAETQGFTSNGKQFDFSEASKYNGVAIGLLLEATGLLPLGTVPETLDVEAKDGSVITLNGVAEMVSFWASGLATGAAIATQKNTRLKNAQ